MSSSIAIGNGMGSIYAPSGGAATAGANPGAEVASALRQEPASASGQTSRPLDMQHLEKEVARANRAMETQQQDISFSIDRDADTLVIKVINRTDKQVVKQIPSEQMLDFMHRVNAALESKASAGMLLRGEA
jgi:flagellar protein FlaG